MSANSARSETETMCIVEAIRESMYEQRNTVAR
jgi:hypothetical protein